MNKANSFHALIDYFRHNNWNFQADEAHQMLHTSYQIRNGTVRCSVVVDGSDDLIQAVIFLPFVVPKVRRLAAGELCVRLSSTLKLGRFDMNYRNGELRLHMFSIYPKGELKNEVIRRLIGISLTIVDRFFLAFTGTVYANLLPVVAAARVWTQAGGQAAPAAEPQLEPQPRMNLN